MPNITVELYPRSTEDKAKLARAITDAVVKTIGVSPDSIRIAFIENPPTNVAKGGVLDSEKKTSR